MKSANYFATVRNSPPCTRAEARGTALGAPAAGSDEGQPLTRGPEAVKTKTMRVTLPLCA